MLRDLKDGRTLILLGSRGGETWLAHETFDDNVYDLLGLDPEAASTLADCILERHKATKYSQDADFRQLLKLLSGFPLALEVVLTNLARQTPTEVLAALEAGDVALDTGDSQKKTESILRCIDYSHSNLSPEAQHLLLCLAPFTAVFWVQMLDLYTTHLQQQPALAALPFARWPEVIREAQNWGLVSADPDLPGFLRLQPILPYFLRTRLHTPEQAAMRTAVETAFRQYYDWLGAQFSELLNSTDPQQRQGGQLLTGLEYENLATALQLALAAQASIAHPYFALAAYLDTTQDQRRGLELGQAVLSRLEGYPADQLAGALGYELTLVLDDIAWRQLKLKQYEAAEASYRKALTLLSENTSLDAATTRKFSAPLYHQLGRVAEEQRQFAQARDYFLRALETFVAYDDSYTAGIVLRSLARLWQASGDANLPAAVASVMGGPPEEGETLLRSMLEEQAG